MRVRSHYDLTLPPESAYSGAAVLPLLLRFGIPFLLCWLLLGSGLLAWRRWRDRPWLAAVAGALVVALAALLFHTKWLAVAAVIAGIAALSLAGRGVRR